MKVISHNEIRIIYTDEDYVIKTPIGLFKDINKAIEAYPSLKEIKRIKQCKLCGTYFLRTGSKDHRRVYCSDKCSKKANSNKTNDKYYNKVFVNPNPFYINKYSQELKDRENKQIINGNPIEFTQDDNYWGLGSGNLTETPANNFKSEHKYIKNELRRLGIT